MFSTDLSYTLEGAYREATQRHHAYFCLEHLLFALLYNEEVVEVIQACAADLAVLKKEIDTYLNDTVEKMQEQGSHDELGGPIQTPAVQRVLQRAVLQCHSSGRESVTCRDVLIALFTEEDSFSKQVLEEHGVTRLDILKYISHGVKKSISNASARASMAHDSDDSLQPPPGGYVKSFTEDLTAQAREGSLDPVIGRSTEIQRALQILSRRLKNNPLFVGEAGVGKTALAHGIAQRIISGEVPHQLKEAVVLSLDVGSLVAGTKFRGEFEERIRGLLQELAAMPQVILFIDEIHLLVGTGATGSSSMDAANLFKPALSRGSVRCMGSTTHDEYKKSIEKDRALNRRFSIVQIDEPSEKDALEIVKALAPKYEQHHHVRYTEGALSAAVKLSAKHITDRYLPDKALDVLDEAGAAQALKKQTKSATIREQEIETVVAAIAKVPVATTKREEEALATLEARLLKKIYGQDAAVRSVTLAIQRSRAQLGSPHRPVGSFLFAGPTGVGKTELAKTLASELGITFHRFDMSEYMEKHAVARLVGAPPGYVGYEEGGLLTDLVRKQPHAVLLFDEIEKAHEDIFNILLQVMDDARLTDTHGKVADFKNVIIILTTNAGSEKSGGLGFGESFSGTGSRDAAIKKLFKPEFRNRLDEVIHFAPLPLEKIISIVGKFLAELQLQLIERNVTFVCSDNAKRYLARVGFDSLLGARPMARVIQREIKDALATELLFGKLKKGGSVSVGIVVTATGESLQVTCEEVKKPKVKRELASSEVTIK